MNFTEIKNLINNIEFLNDKNGYANRMMRSIFQQVNDEEMNLNISLSQLEEKFATFLYHTGLGLEIVKTNWTIQDGNNLIQGERLGFRVMNGENFMKFVWNLCAEYMANSKNSEAQNVLNHIIQDCTTSLVWRNESGIDFYMVFQQIEEALQYAEMPMTESAKKLWENIRVSKPLAA